MKKITCFLRKASALTLGVILAGTASLHAWTTFSLPPLKVSFESYQMGHLPDGRLVLGTKDDLDLQSAFGSAALGDYTNAGSWDPSGVAIQSSTLGAVAQGTGGPSSIYLFNPSNLTSGFTAITGVSIQNYGLAFHDSTSLFVGGQNGSQTNIFDFGQKHSISYVTTSGLTNKVIIDNISEFSAGFAVDLAGNVYVSTADYDLDFNALPIKLYKFTAAQIESAITGSALTLSNGQYLTTLNKSGALAVDGLGRIWASGFGSPGFEVYDPTNNTLTTHVPALANGNYVVSTFSDGTDSYVGYLNASGSSVGSTLTYGYEKATNLVPEPSTSLLLALGVVGFATRRRRV